MAEGLVIISIFSIELAGILVSTPCRPPPDKDEGRPSIKIVTLALPLKLTLPSTSTVMEGTFCKASKAVPPLVVICLSTLKTFLSIEVSISACSAVTTTSFNKSISSCICIAPAST